MSLYVAAYDIAQDARRRRVARVLRAYGTRVQRSVFEIWLDPDEVSEIKRRVGALLARSDEFDLFPVDERGSRTRVSWQRPPESWAPVILCPE